MKKLWIQCPQCTGYGRIPMPDGLTDTLRCVKNISSGISVGAKAEAIYKASADKKWVKVTAINNRLVKLETLGLVYREKRGKEFIWFPKF